MPLATMEYKSLDLLLMSELNMSWNPSKDERNPASIVSDLLHYTLYMLSFIAPF